MRATVSDAGSPRNGVPSGLLAAPTRKGQRLGVGGVVHVPGGQADLPGVREFAIGVHRRPGAVVGEDDVVPGAEGEVPAQSRSPSAQPPKAPQVPWTPWLKAQLLLLEPRRPQAMMVSKSAPRPGS